MHDRTASCACPVPNVMRSVAADGCGMIAHTGDDTACVAAVQVVTDHETNGPIARPLQGVYREVKRATRIPPAKHRHATATVRSPCAHEYIVVCCCCTPAVIAPCTCCGNAHYTSSDNIVLDLVLAMCDHINRLLGKCKPQTRGFCPSNRKQCAKHEK